MSSSSFVGEMPSRVGETRSAPVLPYKPPLTEQEKWDLQNQRQGAWEQEAQRRKERRARLEQQLAEAEARALHASAELPIAEGRKKELLSAKERNSEKWLRDPIGYARELKFADNHIRDCETALREPERIRGNIARLDAELQGDELALVLAWNTASEATRKLLLKMIGLGFVDTDTVHGAVNVVHPLPTTRG